MIYNDTWKTRTAMPKPVRQFCFTMTIEEKANDMIKSMTGFGRGEASDGDRKFTVEMKSVNHRYLDVNIRMPKKLNFFDSAIRALLKSMRPEERWIFLLPTRIYLKIRCL